MSFFEFIYEEHPEELKSLTEAMDDVKEAMALLLPGSMEPPVSSGCSSMSFAVK